MVMELVRGAESVDVALQWEARERRGHLQGERGPNRHTMGGRFKREGVGRGAFGGGGMSRPVDVHREQQKKSKEAGHVCCSSMHEYQGFLGVGVKE